MKTRRILALLTSAVLIAASVSKAEPAGPEADAYNKVMRDWHAKNPPKKN